jgi:hypothetical protein
MNIGQTSENRAVIEALGPEGSALRRGDCLGDSIDAAVVGSHLATRRNFKDMSADGVLAALGPVWREVGRDYPRALGEALARAGLEPDVAALRTVAVNAIIAFYNPLPLVVNSRSKRIH